MADGGLNVAAVAAIAGGVLTVLGIGVFMMYGNKKKTGLADDYQKFKLVEKENVSHDTRRFKFALQTEETVLGLPVGKHMNLRFTDSNGEVVERPYTPTSSDDELGHFILVIKIYPNGKMGQYLDKLSVGDYVECQGPKGRIHYNRPSHFSVALGKKVTHLTTSKINMICGGTGLTPMYQVIQQIVKDPKDKSEVKCIVGNITEDDILLRPELEQFRKSSQVDITFTLDKAPAGWKEETGYVTGDMIDRRLAPPSDSPVTLICGPPPMVKAVRATLKTMGYPRDRVLTF